MADRDRLHDRAGPPAHGHQKGLEERGPGRSRGGPASNIHLACDGHSRPPAFLVTAGHRNQYTQAKTVIGRIRIRVPGPGRVRASPRSRPDHVVADKGYSTRTFRPYLCRRGIKTTVPERVDQLAGRRRRRERPRRVRQSRLPRRHVVERCFHRLKQWRGITTHYDKHPGRSPATITLASTLIRLDR
ncbi:IS5 family transposase [Streptomyces sp. R-07]|uniref:IS5 family transposase n=1 Tax=Streptomyces sp. R-07 TaxID=3404052 RepID=UPI003CEA79B2